MAKGLSAAKAKKILQDGYVKGKPLTAKQTKYFGAIASGGTPLKKLNGGWLDKFGMGGNLPGASGMMYSRNSGSSAMSPPNLTKAQDGTVEYGTPEYKKAYEEGTFADVPNQLDEVVMYSGVDYEKYPYYNDLSAEQRKYFNDSGSIGRGVRRAAYTKRGLAEDTYDVVNPLMYGMLGLAGGMMAGPSIATLGRAAAPYASRYLLNPIQRALSYKPLGGPVSIGNTIDAGSAAYAAYATPEAYDKFKENPSWDTGTDLGLTAMDMIPYSEIFTGGKNIKNLYNKGKNLFTKTPTPAVSNAIDASIDPGISSNFIPFLQDVMDTPAAQVRASEKFNKNWFNNPDIIKKTEQMLNQPSRVRADMSEVELLQDINMYNTMLDKTPNLPVKLQNRIKDNLKDLKAGLAKRNLETVQQKGRFTEVFDENNLNHQDMGIHYDENPGTLGVYKGSTNQATVNLERIKQKAKDAGSVITHEDLHAITVGKAGYTDEAKDILNSAVGKDQDWWLNKINTTKDQKTRQDLIDRLEYLARPQEIHARVHELRKAFNLKPGQEVSPSKIEAIMTKGLKGETPVDEDFFRLLGDKENFRKIFNKLPAFVPAAVGLGAVSQNKNGGDVDKAQWGKILKTAKNLYKGFKSSSNVVEPILESGITARRLAGDQLYNTHRYSAQQLNQLLEESREFLKNTSTEGYENSAKFKDEVLRKIEKLEPGIKKDLALQEIAKRSGRTVGDDTGTWMAKSYIDAPSNDQLGHVTTSNNLWDMVFKSDGKMIPYSNSETLYFNRGGAGQLARVRMMAPENQGGGINLIFDNNSLKKSGILPDTSGGELTISQDVSLKHLYPEAKVRAKDMLLNEAELRGVEITDDLVKSIDDYLQINKNKEGGSTPKAQVGDKVASIASQMQVNEEDGGRPPLGVVDHIRALFDEEGLCRDNTCVQTVKDFYSKAGVEAMPKDVYNNREFLKNFKEYGFEEILDQKNLQPGDVLQYYYGPDSEDVKEDPSYLNFPYHMGVYVNPGEYIGDGDSEAPIQRKNMYTGTKDGKEYKKDPFRAFRYIKQNKNGSDVEKAQWGKLLRLAKKYGNKVYEMYKGTDKVVDAASTTGKLKYMDELSSKAKKDVYEQNYEALTKTDKETRNLGKPHIAQEEYGEGWKYSDQVDFNNPEEVAAHRKRWIASQKKGNLINDNRRFPFFDETSDIFSDLSRKDLSGSIRDGLSKRFGTIGNSYTTGYGHKGLDYRTDYLNNYFKDYRVTLPDGSNVPYGKLDGSVEIDPSSFNSSDEVMEELRRLAQIRMGDQFNNAFEKTSRIDFGDLLKNKNRNGGWLSKYENGGVIEDDRGQWAHPGEVTKINSNNITMKGVNYPVLGVSDTGDTKMMQPGVDNYKYDGNSVTEYPMAQDGINAVPDPTPQINFMKDWASSAMHNKMLDASSSSDKFKNKVKSARSNFDDVTIGMFDDPGYLGLYSNSNIRMNPSLLEEAPIGNGYNSILTHELSHYTDDVNPSGGYFKGYNIPLSDQKLIKDYSKQGVKRAKAEEKELNKLLKSENMNPNSKDVIKDRVKRLKYLGDPTETRSRINATRYFYENDKNFGRSSERNIDKNLPSIFDSEVTPDMIKVMQESGQYKQLQELYTDDQILEMFNTISDNSKSSDPSNMAYAKEGESLVALDQLTNFTNYNTPQPGGWLDKY